MQNSHLHLSEWLQNQRKPRWSPSPGRKVSFSRKKKKKLLKCLADILTIMIVTRMTSTAKTGIPRANQSNEAEGILDLRGVRKCRSVPRRPRRRNIDHVQKTPQRGGIPLLHTEVRIQQTKVLLDHNYRSFPLLQKDNISKSGCQPHFKRQSSYFSLNVNPTCSALFVVASFQCFANSRFYDLFFNVWRSSSGYLLTWVIIDRVPLFHLVVFWFQMIKLSYNIIVSLFCGISLEKSDHRVCLLSWLSCYWHLFWSGHLGA